MLGAGPLFSRVLSLEKRLIPETEAGVSPREATPQGVGTRAYQWFTREESALRPGMKNLLLIRWPVMAPRL